LYHLIFIVKIKLIMKVCIIGDGLTSLALAKALINKDIIVDVIRSKKLKKINKTSTLGISKSNFQFFNKNIININKITWNIKKIKIYTENLKGKEVIQFSESNDQLFSILKNKNLLEQLDYELKRNKYFNYKKKNSYNGIIKLKYDLIINCDFNHEITKKFFSKKIVKNYKSIAFTTVIKHKKLSPNNTAIQIFTRKGPLAFLPISEVKTSIVYSIKNAEHLKELDILNLINKFNSKYEIEKIDKISKFNLNSISLRKYYENNILAFGDLLHKIHPLAGQGFNMSIRDIKDLLKIIQEKIELGLPLDSNVCDEFQDKTKSKNYFFSNGIDLVYEFFNLESRVQNRYLSSMLKFIGKNKTIKKYFKKFADVGLQV